MTRQARFWKRLMSAQADADISFADLCAFLGRLGIDERVRGDHHIFTRPGVDEILNLQPAGSKAKPYQVRQVRNLMRKYHLEEQE
jgi:hypothetical protein